MAALSWLAAAILGAGLIFEFFRKNRREGGKQNRGDFFGAARFVALAADQAGLHDRERFETDELHVALDFTFHARVEKARGRRSAARRNQHENFRTLCVRGSRERERQFVIHRAERFLRAGLADRRAERADHGIHSHRRTGRQRFQFIGDRIRKFGMSIQRPARRRDHAGDGGICECLRQNIFSNRPDAPNNNNFIVERSSRRRERLGETAMEYDAGGKLRTRVTERGR